MTIKEWLDEETSELEAFMVIVVLPIIIGLMFYWFTRLG